MTPFGQRHIPVAHKFYQKEIILLFFCFTFFYLIVQTFSDNVSSRIFCEYPLSATAKISVKHVLFSCRESIKVILGVTN